MNEILVSNNDAFGAQFEKGAYRGEVSHQTHSGLRVIMTEFRVTSGFRSRRMGLRDFIRGYETRQDVPSFDTI